MAAAPERRCCDGCGLPPRGSPLKRCSRCHKSWYHDVECQKRHLVQHRKECNNRAVNKRDLQAPDDDTNESLYRIDEKDGRGRCLVACQSLDVGKIVAPPTGGDSFAPLVPPVLNEANRCTRCAVCFGSLLEHSARTQYQVNAHVEQYPVFICSSTCLQQGKLWLEEEERLVSNLCHRRSNDRCIRILPTAILLYRILRDIAQEESQQKQDDHVLRTRVESLEMHDTDEWSDGERYHVQAVISVSKWLVDGRAQSVGEKEREILRSFSVQFMITTISRIRTNGFSICNGEMVAFGLGLFHVVSNMNHSCRPNAIQTFDYGQKGRLPAIRVTVCTKIPANVEICISYIDNTCPRDLRRKQLRDGYHFLCMCKSCQDDSHDDHTIGLVCPQPTCHGMGKRVNVDSWVCNRCGHMDFEDGRNLMRTFHSTTITEQSYKTARSKFFASSWYVVESGEQFVQFLLDSIDGSDEEVQRCLCRHALAVLDELISASSRNDGWNVLRDQVRLYKAAKLRLFLSPDPSLALSQLQVSLDRLSIYFPKNHEMLQEMRETLSQAA